MCYLIGSEDAEWVDHLFCRIGVCGFSGHEVQESVKVNVAGVVGVHHSQDALEIYLSLN